MHERRRGARIDSRFWLAIAGIDDGLQLRRGNISVSGLYAELEQLVGAPGSVQAIRLAPFDKREILDLLVRVVRVLTIDDLWRGSGVAGVAFEFLPQNEEQRAHVQASVRRLLQTQAAAGDSVELGVPVRMHGESSTEAAVVQRLNVNSMALYTNTPLAVGEGIRCELASGLGESALKLVGRVVQCSAATADGGYQVLVDFADRVGSSAEGLNIRDAINVLLEEAMVGHSTGRFVPINDHMRGLLNRIQLTGLLAFFELERLSGICRVRSESQRAAVYVQEGRVIDVEGDDGSPVASSELRARLGQLLSWNQGEFEFVFQAVARDDRLNTSTTALLLDLARAQDETAR